MLSKDSAFDDFVDDCFIEKDPICDLDGQRSLELVASQLISELLLEQDHDLAA